MKRYLLLLLFLPIFAFASIGKITVLKGDVTIKRGADVLKAKSGTTLEKKDFISTDKNGKVQIVFNDKTIFTIGKNSTLDIADYLYDESKPKKNKAKFNVLKGAFSSISGRIGKLNKSKFKLKTKSASIGIRGTIVKANQEIIMCTEGAITVETLNGMSVRIEAGQKTIVSGGTPSAPMPIEAGEEEALGVDVIYNDNDDTALNDAPEKEVTIKVDDTKVIADNPDPVEPDTKEVTLSGRTIDAQGNQEKINIEGTKIDGQFALDADSGLQMTNDNGQNVESIQDTTVTWGHWADDPNKKWVAGEATDVKVLDEMRNNTEQSVNAQYNGKVMGSVNGSDDIKMDSTNKVQMNFELGAGKNDMDGSMEFQTQSGQNWDSEFSGSTSGNTFSAGATSGTAGGKNLTSGGLDGQFYGDNAQAVGGTFELNTNTDKATGVFKATK